jgi:hypothetical protein
MVWRCAMREIKTIYWVVFYDDETGEIFTQYPFRTWAGARYFLKERIRNNSVESMKTSPIFMPTPMHPEGELLYLRLGMKGVDCYNTCIRIKNVI